jgi:regulator of nucleoside diphosphate kinase
MTTISLKDWGQSPPIVVGEAEHRRLTTAALTDVANGASNSDFLLYELDRARIVPDSLLPPDVIRLESVVRYRPIPGDERTIKLVLPEDADSSGSYRLSVTSSHGAALLGLEAGAAMTWIDAEGKVQRLKVLGVMNPASAGDPGPSAA